MLRNRTTGEIYPLNGDMQLMDDMVPVDVPDPKKITIRRGNAYLDEGDLFEEVVHEAPAPKKRTKKTAAAIDMADAPDHVEMPSAE
jgi:hypothetical protein